MTQLNKKLFAEYRDKRDTAYFKWTEENVILLKQAVLQHGTDFDEIRKYFFPNLNRNQVKSKYYMILRQDGNISFYSDYVPLNFIAFEAMAEI